MANLTIKTGDSTIEIEWFVFFKPEDFLVCRKANN